MENSNQNIDQKISSKSFNVLTNNQNAEDFQESSNLQEREDLIE